MYQISSKQLEIIMQVYAELLGLAKATNDKSNKLNDLAAKLNSVYQECCPNPNDITAHHKLQLSKKKVPCAASNTTGLVTHYCAVFKETCCPVCKKKIKITIPNRKENPDLARFSKHYSD